MCAKVNVITHQNLFSTVYLRRYSQQLVLALLFIVAFGIRLYYVNRPPLDFHATRQYRSLLIARGYYFESVASIPEWERRVAEISKQRQGVLEPPIMEVLVATGYRLLGGERLWLPHVLSSLFWLIGGAFLYLISKRIADADAALAAITFYLFLPFAIIASRSFQPDPLMVMLLLAALWEILCFHERPSRSRFLISACLSAFAFVVKPGSLFVLIAAFLALSISRYGIRRTFFSKSFWLFFVFTVAPAVSIYIYGTLKGIFLIGEAQKTVLPHLLLTSFFWRGWLTNIDNVVGYPALMTSLLGVLFLRPGLPRALLVGMWAGYMVFCLALNYNVATHDYYQLQLVPIVGLSLGPLVAFVARQALQMNKQWYWRGVLVAIVALALALNLRFASSRLAGSNTAAIVQSEEKIGEQVGHSTQTIFLASDYGVSLEYHGHLSGKPWPLQSDLEWERLADLPVVSAEQRFQAWFVQASPTYFIVLDVDEYKQQPDLEEFLTQTYPIVAQNDDYLIFDLKHKQ